MRYPLPFLWENVWDLFESFWFIQFLTNVLSQVLFKPLNYWLAFFHCFFEINKKWYPRFQVVGTSKGQSSGTIIINNINSSPFIPFAFICILTSNLDAFITALNFFFVSSLRETISPKSSVTHHFSPCYELHTCCRWHGVVCTYLRHLA